MFEKGGKFYADWRDAARVRHRNAFTSARAALTYEKQKREAARPNPHGQENHWRKSCTATSKGEVSHKPTAPTVQQRASSLLLVHSAPRNSLSPNPSNVMKCSAPRSSARGHAAPTRKR
jgi:hypothetical protein